MNFKISKTKIKDVLLGEIISKNDERGYFERVYCFDEFKNLLNIKKNLIQINRSMSKIQGTIRGFHFQWPPYQESRIVSCPKGKIFDVAVDLRKGSQTYLDYVSYELSETNKKFLLIPEGFGHGFQTLEPYSETLYLVTGKYSFEHEDGISPFEPKVKINWPLECEVLSEKDKNRKYLKDRDFSGILL